MSRLVSAWRNLRRRAIVEREIDDEVRAAYEQLVDENRRGGMAPDDRAASGWRRTWRSRVRQGAGAKCEGRRVRRHPSG